MNDEPEVRRALTAILTHAPQPTLSSSRILRAGRTRRRIRRTLIALGLAALVAVPTTGYARHVGLVTPADHLITPPEPRLNLQHLCRDGADTLLTARARQAIFNDLSRLVTGADDPRPHPPNALVIRTTAMTLRSCGNGRPVRTALVELATEEKSAMIQHVRITMELYTEPAPGAWKPGFRPNPWPDSSGYGYAGGGDDVDFHGLFGRYCVLKIEMTGSGLDQPYPLDDTAQFVTDPRIVATAYELAR